jgi:hypothetical protein
MYFSEAYRIAGSPRWQPTRKSGMMGPASAPQRGRLTLYRLIEATLGDLTRLYPYKQQDAFRADFSLKGFDYPWILSSHSWQPGEKVLDVGAAYSPLPIHIQETFKCEMWVADDYGLKSNDPFWARNASPQEYIASHPQIKYVLERLGDPATSSLPLSYFDLIYSASTLEHVPYELSPSVWRHMDALLKPGGEMLHAIDIPFPSNGGLKKILMAIGFDALYAFLPYKFKLKHFLATPKVYTRLVFQELGINEKLGKELSVLNMVHNPDILTESHRFGLNRIVKDKMTDYRYQRVATLLLRMQKLE